MTWVSEIKGDSLSWLLEADNPGVRYLALRDILERDQNDPELISACALAHRQGPIATILDHMQPEGYWVKPGPGYTQKYRSTVWALILLAQLGADIKQDARISTGCRYLLDHALAGVGQFTYNDSPAGTIDCLQGNLCWALTELGCTDVRLAAAYEWMARSVTGEDMKPIQDSTAVWHYYSANCGPNFACSYNRQLPCSWAGIKVLLALGRLAPQLHTPLTRSAVQQAVDFFFSIEPLSAAYPTKNNNKPDRRWWKLGFPVFYVADILQLVEALAAAGFGKDPRLVNALNYIREKQDETGRWKLEHEYGYRSWSNFGEKDSPNKWVTLRALRVLKACWND